MADAITMHPAPEPLRLNPKAIKAIAPAACLDVGYEDLYRDNPEELLEVFPVVARNVAYVEALMSGELTEVWMILDTQKRLGEDEEETAKEFGTQTFWLEERGSEWSKKKRKRRIRLLRKLRVRARYVAEARRACQEWWEAYRQHEDDREAAQRLGLVEGGEG